jgi:ABC-2 type transport system ATP-binding protein
MPEERGLYPKKTVLEQLYYLGELRGLRRREVKRRATELLERLGMEDSAEKKLDTLSKGNQQKIQLVATLLTDPDIVVLDEPFSGLDPVNASLLKEIVREQIERGKLLFFSSHQMHYVEEFCDDIAILSGGKIVLSGALREIKRGYDRRRVDIAGPQNEDIADFLRVQGGEWAQAVEPVNDQGEQTLRVTMRGEEQKSGLLGALLAQGLDLDRFEVYEPTLNEIFVACTEDGI